MEQVVYGLFRERRWADRAVRDALATLNQPEDAVSVTVHEQHVEEGDLPPRGTQARRIAIWGALGTALGAAVLGALVLGPLGLGITGAGIAAVLAGIFGALGGAICGSTDPRSELDRFARALDRGNVLVTMDIEDGYAVGDVIKAFERDGALDAGVL